MSNPQPIQFLLHQLATNEQDRERFNLFWKPPENESEGFGVWSKDHSQKDFDNLAKDWSNRWLTYRIKIIRTCLSRVNGEAVLRVFDKKVFDFDFVGQARWDSNAKQIKEILNDNNLYQRELKLKELRLLAYYFRQPIYFVNNGRYKNPNDNYEYTNHNISAWMVTNNYYLNPFHFGDVSKFGDLGKLSDLDKDNLFFLFPEKQNKHLLQKLDLFFLLNQAFDFPLRNGKPLSEAIQALHNKMIELVPKYVEFINNNK